MWALDFQFDETTDRRRLKSLHVVDEHTRGALAMRVGRTCTSDQVVDVIIDLVAARGAPEHLRMDNGPEMAAWALRDYCRLAGTRSSYIEPCSPWENPFIESFNSRVRDELFNVEEFATLLEAQVVVAAWRIEYNTYRPHSSLGDLTPAEYAATGPAPTNQHPHSGWTTTRGPVSGPTLTPRRHTNSRASHLRCDPMAVLGPPSSAWSDSGPPARTSARAAVSDATA